MWTRHKSEATGNDDITDRRHLNLLGCTDPILRKLSGDRFAGACVGLKDSFTVYVMEKEVKQLLL